MYAASEDRGGPGQPHAAKARGETGDAAAGGYAEDARPRAIE